jgi:hypothetical protein
VPPPAYRSEVDVTLFYDVLAPYGDWLWLDPWGWVWTPRHMPTGWRPYTSGRWLYTDAGWTWVSDLPWGWAPFHYGRWTHDAGHGWLWVPGTIWAPAWVAWRWGEGWVGWAPLPPEAHWHVGVGLDLDGWLLRLDFTPEVWSFAPAGRLLEPRLRHSIVPQARNRLLLPLTRQATRYEPWVGGVAERGLELGQVEERLRRAVPRYGLDDVSAPPRRAERHPQGGRVAVYRPQVQPAPDGRAPRRTRPGDHGPGG